VEGGGGDVLLLLGLDAGEAEVELGEAGLVAGRVGAGELGVHQVDGPRPRARGQVQADQLLAGVAVARVLLERPAVEGGRLVDVAEMGLVEHAELDQRRRHRGPVVAAQVLDAPAQQRRQLRVRAQLLVELAQVLVGPQVLGLGLQRADQGVRRLGLVLDAVVPQLVRLKRQLADLRRVADARRVEHQQRRERAPVLGLAQAPARAQERVVAARLLAIAAQLRRLARGRGRERAGEVLERGGVWGRGGEVHGSGPGGRERTPYHGARTVGRAEFAARRSGFVGTIGDGARVVLAPGPGASGL
jgi:hypothetical protein